VPTISKQFSSFGDIAWYEAGFLLPFCVLQLLFGRIYQFYSIKLTLIVNTAIFEIGSIICATAPNSKALIVGRVITGIGGAGVPPGALLLITYLVPVQARPKYIGSLGSVFGITSIIGPILGGYLTSVSWRWCFWINLPVGGVSMVMLMLLTPKCTPPVKRAATWKGKFFELDPFGFVLIATSLICLLLAIQFGSNQYKWSSGVVIALFVIAGVSGAAFIAFQIWRGEKGTIPPQIISQRSILAGSIASLGIGSVLVLFSFYLPIWFQVIQGKSPEDSGLSLIPLLLSVVFAVIASGIFASAVGYYMPPMVLGSALAIVGAGLISTWSVDVDSGKWIGFQVSKLENNHFHPLKPARLSPESASV
jgi:MFS family permease